MRSTLRSLSAFSGCALLCLSSSAFAQNNLQEFTMDGEFGFILTSGNTEATSLSAGLKGAQELQQWSNEYILEALYKQDEVSDGENSTETTAQKFFISAQGNYKLNNENQRLFAFASYEDDRFSNFDYQATVALGWNHLLIDDDKQSFNYSIGPGYAFAQGIDGENLDSIVIRGALDYSYVLSDNAKLTQQVSTEYGETNTKTRSKTSVSAKLANGLSMKVSLKLDHNSEVDQDRENLDTETSVTLVYTFF